MRINAIKARIAPKLPASRTDPVMAAKLVNKSFKKITSKYNGIKKEISELFNSIETIKQTNNALIADEFGYLYNIDVFRLGLINERIAQILEKWILEGREVNEFWFGQVVESAYQSGTWLAHSNLAAMSAIYSTERTLQEIITSDAYRRRIGIAYSNSYENWIGLSNKTRRKLSGIISEAVASGRNPTTIVTELMKSLDVSRSEAENIAQTEITGTLRQARLDEADISRRELGLDTAIFWTSALIPTTRPWHAARHGKTFSTDEVRIFYSQRGNRYRCYCGLTEIILFDGKAEISENMKNVYREEFKKWKKSHDKTK